MADNKPDKIFVMVTKKNGLWCNLQSQNNNPNYRSDFQFPNELMLEKKLLTIFIKISKNSEGKITIEKIWIGDGKLKKGKFETSIHDDEFTYLKEFYEVNVEYQPSYLKKINNINLDIDFFEKICGKKPIACFQFPDCWNELKWSNLDNKEKDELKNNPWYEIINSFVELKIPDNN